MKTPGLVVWIVCALAAAGAGAQPAGLANARVETRAVAGPLDAALERGIAGTAGPAWIAYEVPLAAGDRFVCDWNARDRALPPVTTVKLDGPSVLRVFYRIEDRAVTRIRMFSEGCSIDAGDRPVLWLTGVRPDDSVAVLRAYAAGDADRRVRDGALAALSLHADPSATTAMIAVARTGQTPQLRGQALFWLAQRAGEQAVGAITDAVANDPDTAVRKRAVFALSQLPGGEGVPRLIEVARTHSNAAVRKQAMFWLGQSRDPRALAFFESILVK